VAEKTEKFTESITYKSPIDPKTEKIIAPRAPMDRFSGKAAWP
jgi:hypothetical protein